MDRGSPCKVTVTGSQRSDTTEQLRNSDNKNKRSLIMRYRTTKMKKAGKMLYRESTVGSSRLRALISYLNRNVKKQNILEPRKQILLLYAKILMKMAKVSRSQTQQKWKILCYITPEISFHFSISLSYFQVLLVDEKDQPIPNETVVVNVDMFQYSAVYYK